MVASIRSSTLLGVDARLVEVEVEFSAGLPVLSVIGLADAAVKEARYRIQSALRASGREIPHRKITINLAPAGVRKDGASLDLPMALGVLRASGVIPADAIADTLAVGELALTGRLRPIRGVLPIASLARTLGVRKVIVPRAN